MFGQSKPIFYEPYGKRRSRWRLPRWMVLLVAGILIGAAGVLVVQERYLPPRLSPAASEELRRSFEDADGARQRLTVQLGDAVNRLEAALADRKNMSEELATARSGAEALRNDLNSVVASLPRDPRGGAVEIRAGWFVAKGGSLGYDLVLTREAARERAQGAPLSASMQFVISGESAGGTPRTFSPPATAVSIAGQQVLRGSLALPEGFVPREATVQIAERNGGGPLGMRVLLVK